MRRDVDPQHAEPVLNQTGGGGGLRFDQCRFRIVRVLDQCVRSTAYCMCLPQLQACSRAVPGLASSARWIDVRWRAGSQAR